MDCLEMSLQTSIIEKDIIEILFKAFALNEIYYLEKKLPEEEKGA